MENKFFRFLTGNTTVFRRCSALLLAAVFCALFFLPASAAEWNSTSFPGGSIDLNRRGSVHIDIEDEKGNPVSDGSAQLYCVAQVTETDGKQSLTITDSFSGWDGDTKTLFSDRTSAESLADYAAKNSVEYSASAEIKDGTIVFTDLAPGAYLVMQDEPADGYEKISPFLAFLPQASGEELIYDIQAQPKPVKIISPGTVEITAQKEVAVISGKAPENTLFSFVLTAVTPGAPMPEKSNAVYSSDRRNMTVSRTGPGAVSFGSISFTEADEGSEYEYTIREVKGSVAHYTYDSTVYKMKISVLSAENGKPLSVSIKYTDENGKEMPGAIFQNIYDSNGNTPNLPHTGQLWWPVFVLIPCGILFIIIGIIHFRRGKAEEAEDAA